MQVWQLAAIILGSLSTLGIVAGGFGYLWSVFSGKTRQEKTEVVSSADQLTSFWRDQAEGYKAMMAEKDAKTSEQINDLSRQVGELRGQLNEKTNQAKEYLEILQNRNPEMQKFMETLTAVAQQSQVFMKENVVFQKEQAGIMEQILTFMGNINTRLETVDKDLKIEATVSKAV